MPLLIMCRHGESLWNKCNVFTGWVDVPLSEKGMDEALKVGEKIKTLPIDVVFTSALIRSKITAFLALSKHFGNKIPVIKHQSGNMKLWATINSEEAQQNIIPVFEAWQLNERMYGDLQGLNKQKTIEKYGKEQVHIWRRSFDVAPKNGESLKMTKDRTIPYFNETILPYIKNGKNVFISAHGNSLRSIVMELDNLSEEEICNYEIATGEIVSYDYTNGKFKKL